MHILLLSLFSVSFLFSGPRSRFYFAWWTNVWHICACVCVGLYLHRKDERRTEEKNNCFVLFFSFLHFLLLLLSLSLSLFYVIIIASYCFLCHICVLNSFYFLGNNCYYYGLLFLEFCLVFKICMHSTSTSTIAFSSPPPVSRVSSWPAMYLSPFYIFYQMTYVRIS